MTIGGLDAATRSSFVCSCSDFPILAYQTRTTISHEDDVGPIPRERDRADRRSMPPQGLTNWLPSIESETTPVPPSENENDLIEEVCPSKGSCLSPQNPHCNGYLRLENVGAWKRRDSVVPIHKTLVPSRNEMSPAPSRA
jgi:hypothetical protein